MEFHYKKFIQVNAIKFGVLSVLYHSNHVGWLVVGFESSCLPMGPGTIGGMPSVGVLLRDPSSYFTRVSEKTTENFERLGRQERPGFESGISRLPVLSVTTP